MEWREIRPRLADRTLTEMHRALQEILSLDAERDCQRITYLISCYEFPFDTTRSLEFALFRTYAVETVGKLLYETGEFTQRTQKRYDDTDLILSEMVEHGLDSERGKAAFRRMNRMHGQYAISNRDFLYVLSTFIYEQVRWNRKFGWREMTDTETRALYYFWREVGKRMGIKEIPGTYAEFEAFNMDYERRFFQLTEGGRRVAESTRDLFLGWFLPKKLYDVGAPFIYAMLDEPLLKAFGFPAAPGWISTLVSAVMRVRAAVMRWLPERRRPKHRTALSRPSYPDGYEIEQLGTEISRG